jgi:hypothetical protein
MAQRDLGAAAPRAHNGGAPSLTKLAAAEAAA